MCNFFHTLWDKTPLSDIYMWMDFFCTMGAFASHNGEEGNGMLGGNSPLQRQFCRYGFKSSPMLIVHIVFLFFYLKSLIWQEVDGGI